MHVSTSNVTSINEVHSTRARLFASMRRPLESVITTFYYVAIIFHHRVWYRALSLYYACILIPIGYLCAKFNFFPSLHCWASRCTQSITHSINQSLTQLIWCPGNWSSYASELPPSHYLRPTFMCNTLNFIRYIHFVTQHHPHLKHNQNWPQ